MLSADCNNGFFGSLSVTIRSGQVCVVVMLRRPGRLADGLIIERAICFGWVGIVASSTAKLVGEPLSVLGLSDHPVVVRRNGRFARLTRVGAGRHVQVAQLRLHRLAVKLRYSRHFRQSKRRQSALVYRLLRTSC